MEISEKYSKGGVSRFDGFMRQPSYSQAYLKTAKIVQNKALEVESPMSLAFLYAILCGIQ